MTQTAKALYDFFSSFGIPAFVEYTVPDELPDENGNMQKVVPPYITYQLVEPDWRDSSTLYARVWYRSTTWVNISATVDAIKAAVKDGLTLPTDSGIVMLNPGTPFSQEQPMEGDDTLKVIYLNFQIDALTL